MDKITSIGDQLSWISIKHGVRIAFACESGSREWGFASPDSDFDVRFVYVRPMADYLRLEEPRDVIEEPEVARIDASGWDLRKFLRLLRNSNPSAIEWLSSTTVYHEEPAFVRARELVDECFSPTASAWHYYGMVKRHDARYLRDELVQTKKYLYVVRAILAAEWSITRLTRPPMPFLRLCEGMLDDKYADEIEILLASKATSDEMARVEHLERLDGWIETSMMTLPGRINELKAPKKPSWDKLDAAFHAVAGF